MTDLTNPIYNDDEAARAHLEALRWPNGPVCSHCGVVDEATKLAGKSTRPGVWKCRACEKPFSVTVGTVFERSHIPLHKWVLATHLLSASKKGMSAHQLHRMLGITYKSAWFMAHRIREAMTGTNPGPMGGKGKIVEADETFLGNSGDKFTNEKGWSKKRGVGDKMKIVTLVERGGRARSLKVDDLNVKTISEILTTNVSKHTNLMTDEAPHYRKPGKEFARHHSVNHSKGEYAKGFVTTNTVEGYFSIFKRGMTGIYQHCGEQHLQRYLTEFDFRYSNRKISDAERAEVALKGAEGKRLTYHQAGSGKAVA